MVGLSDIYVIEPGLFTTIQDLGRVGYRQFGVPSSGAMDKESLLLANLLVGNKRGEAGLEITILGPKLKFNTNTAIGITGANMTPIINGREIKMYSTVYVSKNDILEFSNLKEGSRCYFSVRGGFKVDHILNSKSTFTRGNFGGYKGRMLKKGDLLKICKVDSSLQIGVRNIPHEFTYKHQDISKIRLILGPHYDEFTKKSKDTLWGTDYIISNSSDRMGYRLDGEPLEHKKEADIISSGLTFGTIQVPGKGIPIIVMADCQTTGGYTVIGNVITEDLPKLGQLKPGDKIRFEQIDLNEAQLLIKIKNKKIDELETFLNNESEKLRNKEKNYIFKVNNIKYNVSCIKIDS